MTKVKLTSAGVLEMETPGSGQVLVFDSALPGFGVRLTPNKKTYIVQSRVNGKTRRVTVGSAGVFSTEKARIEAKKLLGQMAGDVDPNAVKAESRAKTISFDKAWSDYLTARTLKPSTRYLYDLMFTNYFAKGEKTKEQWGSKQDWGGKEIASITPALAAKQFATLTKEHGQGTANGAFRVFRAVYNHARATSAKPDGSYTLPENPVRRLSETTAWHKLGRRQTYIAADDLPSWFGALNTLDGQAQLVRDYLELLLRTGLRRSEGAALHWDNVNLKARTFTVKDTKNGTDHQLPLSKQVEALLERRREATGGKGYVFPSDSKAGHLGDPRKTLLKVREASGTTPTLHDMRRTFITVAARRAHVAGATLRDVQILAGHASIETTQLYIEGCSEAQQRLVSCISK